MPAESKLGDICLDKDEFVCRALWRPLDGTPDVLLCTVHIGAYETHAFIREGFINLAGAIAVNLDRPAGSAITVQRMPAAQPIETKLDRRQFACWTCTQPQAADARHCLSAFSDADLMARLSPGGTPMFCCRITPVGAWAATQ
jgi:hypothetical protein